MSLPRSISTTKVTGPKAPPILSSTIKALIAGFVIASTWPTSLLAEDVIITIRLINGKNGKPIQDEDLNIFRNGSRFAENYRADPNGLIRLSIDRDAVLELGSNIQVTCHPYNVTDEEKTHHMPRLTKVRQIMEEGVSDQNMCSKKVRVEAKPGEFIFYERSRTLWEWMAL